MAASYYHTYTAEEAAGVLSLAVQGDKVAQAQLYAWFAPEVKRFVYKRVRVRAEVEDITQDVFLKVLSWLPRWQVRDGEKDAVRQFGAWLYQIARNRITDYYRIPECVDLLDEQDEVVDESGLLGQWIEQHVEQERVRWALAYLARTKPRQAQALELFYLQEFSRDEVCEFFGMNPATKGANTLLWRGTHSLTEILLVKERERDMIQPLPCFAALNLSEAGYVIGCNLPRGHKGEHSFDLMPIDGNPADYGNVLSRSLPQIGTLGREVPISSLSESGPAHA